MQVKKQQLELDMEQRLVPNRKRSTSGYILSPCLFDLYTEYIMRNTGLNEAQAGIKISRRNISNLRYADDTTLMAENEKELKILLMKVKAESEKTGLKLSSGHGTGKGQFSFQSQKRVMPKNAQTTTQLHSSHMPVKKCSKFSKPGFSNT